MREGPIPMTAALTRENRDTNAGRRRGEDQATEKKHPESVVSRNWDPRHTHTQPQFCTLHPAFSDWEAEGGSSMRQKLIVLQGSLLVNLEPSEPTPVASGIQSKLVLLFP